MNNKLNNIKIKVLYISPRDMFKAKSDPIHIMASCKWFRKSGADVELLAPYYHRLENILEKDIFKTYGIQEGDFFTITHLRTKLTDRSSPFSIRLNKMIAYSWDAFKRFVLTRETNKFKKYVIYSKCYFSFLPYYYLSKVLMLKNVIFVFEVASFLGRSFESKVLKKYPFIVAINPYLKCDLVQIAKIEENKIIVPPFGVDDTFEENLKISKKEARQKIGFPENKFLVVYSGKILIAAKSEIEMILEAAKKLPGITFYFTGGKQKDIKYYNEIVEKNYLKNVRFIGFFASQKDSFVYLRAADVLVSFYPKTIPTLKYMGPSKIIQYARAKRPIITARYAAIEVILGEEGAIYVEPEDVSDLVNMLEKAQKGEIETDKIVENAFNNIVVNSYEKRTEVILSFIFKESKPLVSIIIPTYNCAHVITDAIESVIQQTYSNIEIIIIDDGSDDHTKDVLKPYTGHIRYYYQKNKGLMSARNKGIEIAKGELIAYLDADDVWMPTKLSRQIEVFNKNPLVESVYSNSIFVDENLNEIKIALKKNQFYSGNVLKKVLLRKTTLQPSTLIIKKECFLKTGVFDIKFKRSGDKDFAVRLAKKNCLFGISEPLVKLRIRNGSLGRCSAKDREFHRFLVLRKVLNENPDSPLIKKHRKWILADYYYLSGLAYIKENNIPIAKMRFSQSIRICPWYIKSIPYLILTLGGKWPLKVIKKVRLLLK